MFEPIRKPKNLFVNKIKLNGKLKSTLDCLMIYKCWYVENVNRSNDSVVDACNNDNIVSGIGVNWLESRENVRSNGIKFKQIEAIAMQHAVLNTSQPKRP